MENRIKDIPDRPNLGELGHVRVWEDVAFTAIARIGHGGHLEGMLHTLREWSIAAPSAPPAQPVDVAENWEDYFKVILQRMPFLALERRQSALEKAFQEHQEKCDSGYARSVIAPITTFAPTALEVIKPFSAVIQGSDDTYIATWFDANISTSGETQQEAFDNLKDLIIMFYSEFANANDEDLGQAMLQQKRVLFEHLQRR